MLRRLKTRSLPPALLPSLPVPFSPSHTLPRRLRPPRLFPILPPRTLLVRPLPPSRPPPVLSFPSHIVPIPRHPLPLHPALPPPPLPSPLPPVFRLPLFPLPRVLPPPSKLSHLLIFPLPQSPPWRLLHLSPIPLAQQAEDAEPIRNGESLMDPPCLHRISRPSHGAAHSSGGATRPSLTGSRPASAPIRTDRPEAQPTARMPPANHGDERKETRHVASAGHHPHPTRSRSYVSSPAELEDAVPPLDAPRDAERRRSFDGSESERASLMRDGARAGVCVSVAAAAAEESAGGGAGGGAAGGAAEAGAEAAAGAAAGGLASSPATPASPRQRVRADINAIVAAAAAAAVAATVSAGAAEKAAAASAGAAAAGGVSALPPVAGKAVRVVQCVSRCAPMLEDNFLNNSARTVYSNVLMPGEQSVGLLTWFPARLMGAVQRSETLVVIALRESIVFLALIALFAVTPNVCRALNWLWASFIMRDGQVTEECFQDSVFGALVLPLQFVAAAFFLTRHMRLLFSLAKLLPPPSVHNSFSGGGASVGGKSPSSSFPLSLTPSSLSLQYAPSPASSQAPPEPVPPAEVQNGFSGGGGDVLCSGPILLNVSRFLSLLIHLVGVGTLLYPPDQSSSAFPSPLLPPLPSHQPTLLNASRFLSLLIHLVGVGTVLPQPANHLSHPPLIPPMLCPMHQRPAHQPILLNASRFLSLLIHLVGVGTVLDLFGVSLLSLVAVGGISGEGVRGGAGESEGGSEGVSGHGAGSLWRVHPLPGGCERHLRWAASQVGGISGVAMGFASKEMVASFFGGLVLVFSQPFVVGEMAKVTATHTAWPTLFLFLPVHRAPLRILKSVAMGFASKKIVANFFGGLVLVISQPFVVGERIQAGAISGRVEEDGVAMGFASKEIVANFFGGLVLVISQPFVVGERIQAGAISGRVEEIGFLHTKLAGANKAPVVVPNQIFNTAVITNFSRARCYPVAVTFELRIEDIERVQAITSRITRMLRSHADVDQSQGPAHAVLKDLNGASLHVGMLASLNPQVRFQVIPGEFKCFLWH
ncbi:unnamed protein product [Closterium sp. NIES-65]|nr:unnamed protein product [Closterium sp. NIES-65]